MAGVAVTGNLVGQQGSWQLGGKTLPSDGHRSAQPHTSGSIFTPSGHGSTQPGGSLALGSVKLGQMMAQLSGYLGAGDPSSAHFASNAGKQHGSTQSDSIDTVP